MSGNSEHADKASTNATKNATLQTALDAYRSGRLDEAEALARTITEKSPQQEDAWRVLAAAAQSQGRLSDAAMTLKAGLDKNPQSAVLFTMLGLVLRDGGRFDDAETALRHALSLKPDVPDAAFDLGNILARQGRLHEAEEIFRSGATAMPRDARFPLQIGRLMLMLGNSALAQQAFEASLAISREAMSRAGDTPQDPSLYLEASAHLGELLLGQGERLKALDHLFDAVQLGGDESVRRQFAACVSAIPFADAQPLLKPLLVRALSEAWAPPDDLMRQCANQLMLDPAFAGAANRLDTIAAQEDAPLQSTEIAKVAGDPLLRAMLVSGIITDPAFERLLSTVRRLLLKARHDPAAPAARGSDGLLAFAAALANQCFFTEFAYAVSDEEAAMASALEARIAEAAQSGGDIAAIDLATLAAYRPLSGLDCAMALAARSWAPSVASVIERQLREPAKEAKLKQAVTRITPITDETSEAVRAQYEENPFPRWVVSPVPTQRTSPAMWLAGLFPHMAQPAERYLDSATPLDVLLAGCGTGQDVIGSATRFENAQVLAVDLSATSLAYAQRKTEEIGLQNVSFAQADILELDGIGRQFDIVECAGVLHHLADPEAGLRILSALTKPGGYMLLALYSKAGRHDLDPARAFVAEGGYGTSADELRRFRHDVLALPADHPVRQIVRSRDDFYNLSMLRDLLFHAQTRDFTLPEIAAMVDRLGLEFCGLTADPEARQRFRDKFGREADTATLGDWDAFEAEYPDTFAAMYHMVLRRPEA